MAYFSVEVLQDHIYRVTSSSFKSSYGKLVGDPCWPFVSLRHRMLQEAFLSSATSPIVVFDLSSV